jgi:flagellar biosynthetic protein FlhB
MGDAMSDAERTHKPTPKREKEFRKRGEIAHSSDLTSAATFAVGLAGAAGGAVAAWGALCSLARTAAAGGELDDIAHAARYGFTVAVAPVLVAALVGCFLGGGLQLGWPPALKTPSFDLGKVFGFAGVAEVLSPRAMARRLFTALAKVFFVGAAVALVVRAEVADGLALADPRLLPARLGHAALRLGVVAALVLGALAGIDYLLARRRIGERMKMTPDELRREHREQEGDPHVKGRRRRRMRELAKRRLVAETKKADVVLVNPTHYAVALRYDTAAGGAPRVVAKGTDEVAARIREAARSAGVPVLSRPPLARALHKLVPEGQEIPPKLFHAVAEVLAYVYRLRDRGVRASS